MPGPALRARAAAVCPAPIPLAPAADPGARKLGPVQALLLSSGAMFGIRSLPRTLEAALRDMRHAKNETRISALRDLVRLAETEHRPRALSALCEVMGSDADLHVRAAAALALGDAGAKESREELLSAARFAPLAVREMALAALGEIAEPCDDAVLA